LQAIENRHTQAMINLAVLLAESDPNAARRWYEQAAAAGNVDAMNSLGELLASSDPEAATRWRKLAAEATDTKGH
jgi:TPR repeat protein